MSSSNKNNALLEIYDRLIAEYGPQHWWPGETPFEVIIGAILTQSAAWTNVEKAINNLKSAGMLSSREIRELPVEELALLIRPSGYYNDKTRKLKSFVNRLYEKHEDSLDKLFALDVNSLRNELLSIHGIGEETADSIILYASGKPVFVIDAYTKRIINRIGLLTASEKYAVCQKYFMDNLPADLQMFTEYHALLVNLGKTACRMVPVCEKCCLRDICRSHKTTHPAGE